MELYNNVLKTQIREVLDETPLDALMYLTSSELADYIVNRINTGITMNNQFGWDNWYKEVMGADNGR